MDPFQGAECLLGRCRDRGCLGLPRIERLPGREPRSRPAGGQCGAFLPATLLANRALSTRRAPSVGPFAVANDLRCVATDVGQPEAAARGPPPNSAGTAARTPSMVWWSWSSSGHLVPLAAVVLAVVPGRDVPIRRCPGSATVLRRHGARQQRVAGRGGRGSRTDRPRRTGRGRRRGRVPSRPSTGSNSLAQAEGFRPS